MFYLLSSFILNNRWNILFILLISSIKQTLFIGLPSNIKRFEKTHYHHTISYGYNIQVIFILNIKMIFKIKLLFIFLYTNSQFFYY